MAESNFKPGDLVQLKAGGPKMVVESASDDWCYCSWFSGAKHNKERFAFAALQEYQEDNE